MAMVEIAFSADPKQVGKVVDVDDVEAATLVREGRARYADKSSRTAKSGAAKTDQSAAK